jgi:hypothetical protein
VKVTGPASLAEFVRLIENLAKETRAHGDNRVLVDLLGVTGALKFTDHFLYHLDKLASVVPEDKITCTRPKKSP